MLRAGFAGLLVKIGLDIAFVLLGGLGSAFVVGLLPGLVGGLVAGYLAHRGFLGGMVAGCLIIGLLFLWTLAMATGWGVPPRYEVMGEFPGLGAVALNMTPSAVAVAAGGLVGGGIRDLLPRWREYRDRLAAARYYQR
jgi:hypothetical protein